MTINERAPRTGTRLSGAALVNLLSSPKSVVIVGASPDPESYASKPIAFLRRYGYAGRILAVNPKYEEIDGVPCLPAIADIEQDSVDVAMVTLPAAKVRQALPELARVGVKAAIVIAGGFDADGGKEREELRAAVRDLPMRVIGPNCIGVVNTQSSTYLTFSREIGRGKPRQGSIALVTQSGAIGNSLLISLLRRGAGISHWITSGDEVDVGSLELISGLLRDDSVRAVGVFLEGMTDLDWLANVALGIRETGKTVYVLKGAQTDAGRSAAAGHTGRVVGASEATLAVLRAAGMTLVPTMAHLADALIALDVLRGLSGPRIAVASISGGCGVMAADAIRNSAHLRLADVASDTTLRALIGGRVSSVQNPLDVAGSKTSVFADWIKGFAASPTTDVVVAIQATMLNPDELLVQEMIARAAGEPVVLVPFTDSEAIQGELAERLARHRIAVMPTIERAISALDVLPIQCTSVLPAAEVQLASPLLGLEEAVLLLPELPWAPMAAVTTEQDGRDKADGFGYPVVIKLAGRAVHHRSESGGVAVGVSRESFGAAFARIAGVAAAAQDVILVQKQISGGMEVMVSAMRDAELGAVVSVHPGGIFTELMDGTAIIWSGWDAVRRRQMLTDSVVGRLLLGYRGGPVFDIESLATVIDQLLAAIKCEKLDFIELNPVIVGPGSAYLVDALVRPFKESQQ
jgi:acyl-CoA synthetase (NDP forming)